jgi:VIT1/CCC1 family predicted Fe2+/Mn2+ transporter
MVTAASGGGERAGAAHAGEAHSGEVFARLNWLRAGVLGANDGIVSVAGLVVGVAGATSSQSAILVAGVAGVVAGAFSMAGGEYVSVSTQRDTERTLLDKERRELAEMPDEELDELTAIYRAKGISPGLARQVAEELTAHDALGAHAEAELGLDPSALTSPWQAAFASFVAFVLGAALPLLTITVSPPPWRILACVVAVALALALTGYVSARLGDARVRSAVARNVGLGLLAMAVTYGIGTLVGTQV